MVEKKSDRPAPKIDTNFLYYPDAIQDPIEGWEHRVGGFSDRQHLKIVHHKTQGYGYPASTYRRTGGIPHFTVGRDRDLKVKVWQHYPLNRYSRALLNLWGGVQTNLDGAFQIEFMGFSGYEDLEVAAEVAKLCRWLEDKHNIPNYWPAGRPPKAIDRGSQYALPKRFRPASSSPRNASIWDNNSGHFGHSQVPENNHWDPAYTDGEWAIIIGSDDGPRFLKKPNGTEEPEVINARIIGLTDPYTTGSDVRRIQEKLNKAFTAGLEEDGVWGPKTNDAARMAQHKMGLRPSGTEGDVLWGPKSNGALNDAIKLIDNLNKPAPEPAPEPEPEPAPEPAPEPEPEADPAVLDALIAYADQQKKAARDLAAALKNLKG